MNSIIHNRSNRLPRIKQLSFCQAGSEYQQLSRLCIHNAIKCSMCSKCPELGVFSALGQLLRWKKKVRRKIIFMTAQADRSSALSTASPSVFWTYKIFSPLEDKGSAPVTSTNTSCSLWLYLRATGCDYTQQPFEQLTYPRCHSQKKRSALQQAMWLIIQLFENKY